LDYGSKLAGLGDMMTATMRKLFVLDPYRRPTKLLGQLPIDYGHVDARLLQQFSASLAMAESQNSEMPMQRFFEKHPVALLSLVSPHTSWVFPRVALQEPLGGGWEPDFLVCDWTSLGPEWTVVELESPTKRATGPRGISAACRHAQQQISDYRRSMTEHTERNENDGLLRGHRQKRSWIIIGRREERTRLNQDRLADLRADEIEVASYDRIYQMCKDMVAYRVGFRKEGEKFLRSVKRELDSN